MRIHLFLCKAKTYGDCIKFQLFGTPSSAMFARLNVGDMALLYNSSPPKKVYGLWRITETGLKLVPEAWGGDYPQQARVQRVVENIVERPYEEVKGLLLDGNRMRDVSDGDDAEALIKVFGPILPTPMPPRRAVSVSDPGKYHMPLFEEIVNTRDAKVFEDSVHDLLRLLGILDLYEIPRTMQAGRSDGFFKIGRLAVLYDATLNENHKEFKAQQVENFIAQISKDQIELSPKDTKSVKGYKKQVWIITRSVTQLQRKVDKIQVSEVGVTDLIHLYTERMTKKLDAEQLEEALAKLGS